MDQIKSRRSAVRRFAVALVCATAIVSAPAAVWADDAAMAKDAGVGLGSAVASLLYAPVKTGYAFGGVFVGGLAYVFSGGDADVARVVLEPSVMGDYVITTEHLSGEREIEFFGRRDLPQDRYQQDYQAVEADVAAAPDGW